MLLFFFTGMAIVIYLNQAGQQPRERDYAYVGSFYAFAIWVGLGVLWVKEMFEKFMKAPMANYVSAGLCLLAVPVIMGTQEWDDHDRSKKTLARDLAKDYLESCPPNAMLFSFGDNDTYPIVVCAGSGRNSSGCTCSGEQPFGNRLVYERTAL